MFMSNASFCVYCFFGDYIIHKKGGHCFLCYKSGVILVTTRLYIKNERSKFDIINRKWEETNMNTSTALGAEKAKEIIFISDVHEKFYYEKLEEVRY